MSDSNKKLYTAIMQHINNKLIEQYTFAHEQIIGAEAYHIPKQPPTVM